jgi:hypothetical protein
MEKEEGGEGDVSERRTRAAGQAERGEQQLTLVRAIVVRVRL